MIKKKSHNFHQSIIREYDIRGIVDKNITENTAYTIGRVFGYIVFEKLKSNNISLGYDGRLTSPKLYKALSIGLKDAGANVIVSGSTIFKNNDYKKIINELRTK